MRLKTIKLAGFKSFVDPVSIPVAGNIVGIVGPNGCGKSNIIDAVRWVMGESSARHLRGDSMSDVIFSGSTARKPVSRASVELVFDNSEGGAGGPYASYREIAIRREVERNGESEYFLNRDRCRRKDIMDLFLGTGLGPRAYAIIEQGMVTRIIESKPEDLRVLFDEAAGVSRYKERRRESEHRMEAARENLARVSDLREEIAKQLGRLHRQAQAAQKFRELKILERRLHAELLTSRERDAKAQIESYGVELRRAATDLEAAVAVQRAAETALDRLRLDEQAARDEAHECARAIEAANAEVTRLEQTISHLESERNTRLREQEQITRDLEHNETTEVDDREKQRVLTERLQALTSVREGVARDQAGAAAARGEAERTIAEWRERWNTLLMAAAEPGKRQAAETSRCAELTRQAQESAQRLAVIEREQAEVENELSRDGQVLASAMTEQDHLCETLSAELASLEEAGQRTRTEEQAVIGQLDAVRGDRQKAEGRLASLEEAQALALGRLESGLAEWLAGHAVDGGRLGQRLRVEPGWEKAVERVLGSDLAAIVTRDLERFAREGFARDAKTVLAFAEQPGVPRSTEGLAAKVEAPVSLAPWLACVQVAESLEAAITARATLAPGQSVVTREGVWMSRDWVRFPEGSGVLVRAREIDVVQGEIADNARQTEDLERRLAGIKERHAALSSRRETVGTELAQANRRRVECHAAYAQHQERHAQSVARVDRLRADRKELQARRLQLEADAEDAGNKVKQAQIQVTAYANERSQMETQGAELETRQRRAQEQARAVDGRAHQLDLEEQAMRTELVAVTREMARVLEQREILTSRLAQITQELAVDGGERTARARIQELLGGRVVLETRAREVAMRVETLTTARGTEETRRRDYASRAEVAREEADQIRTRQQELVLRVSHGEEQLLALGPLDDEARAAMQAPREAALIEPEIATTVARIDRLGPINLAAIEEYDEEAKRKSYLDSQYDDLTRSLEALEEGIRKIDRETKVRFEETFARINEGFQAFFPKLFGGGQASLELTGDNALETGVSVTARPPGKRNSTIHLLSGGEKALTAVALIFAIFELNPAPFCLLDEVDAPLDDANVERYANVLKSMSERTQMLYITHNKVSMEVADQLHGVTMSEPGVSRLVSVDVEQAAKMVGDQRRTAT